LSLISLESGGEKLKIGPEEGVSKPERGEGKRKGGVKGGTVIHCARRRGWFYEGGRKGRPKPLRKTGTGVQARRDG